MSITCSLKELDGSQVERSKPIELGEACSSNLLSTTMKKNSNQLEGELQAIIDLQSIHLAGEGVSNKEKNDGMKKDGTNQMLMDKSSIDKVVDIGLKPQGGVLQMLERKEERVLESLVAQHYKIRLNKIEKNVESSIEEGMKVRPPSRDSQRENCLENTGSGEAGLIVQQTTSKSNASRVGG